MELAPLKAEEYAFVVDILSNDDTNPNTDPKRPSWCLTWPSWCEFDSNESYVLRLPFKFWSYMGCTWRKIFFGSRRKNMLICGGNFCHRRFRHFSFAVLHNIICFKTRACFSRITYRAWPIIGSTRNGVRLWGNQCVPVCRCYSPNSPSHGLYRPPMQNYSRFRTVSVFDETSRSSITS